MARLSESEDTPQYSESQPSNGKTVLLAEDDPFISRMYQTKLASAGYAVVIKNNGRDAYEEIKKSHPDLILLDLNMPEMSGFDMLAALKAESFDFSNSPIMVLTNSANPKDRETAKNYGADYLTKAELTPRDVLDLINNKLGISATPQ